MLTSINKTIMVIMALSVETLESFLSSLTDSAAAFDETPLLVPHPRVATAATERGFTRVFEVPMSAAELIPALTALKPQLLRLTN